MTAPPVALKESIDIPCDDKDSLDESVEAALGNDEASTNEFEASTIHTAGTYSESTNDSGLRFGIRFTTKQYHKTKLLKILSNANAPHYLYKEVMNWGSAARLDNYHFNPTCSSRNAQSEISQEMVAMPVFLSTANPHTASRPFPTGCTNHYFQFYQSIVYVDFRSSFVWQFGQLGCQC
jgi:hypothetical protein